MTKKIIYKIDSNGNGKLIDMIGFGSSCVEAFAATQSKMGAADGEAQYTEEYSKPVDVDINVQQ